MYGHPCNGRWFQRFFLDYEAFKLAHPEDYVVPVAVHLYVDDFGVTLKRKAGGMYVSIANTAFHITNRKDFRPCLGYIPDGVSVLDCLGGDKDGNNILFVKEMRMLERGYRMWSGHHQRYIVLWGRLFLNIADFPQAQELCGALGTAANSGCRLCSAKKGTYATNWSLRTNETPMKGNLFG